MKPTCFVLFLTLGVWPAWSRSSGSVPHRVDPVVEVQRHKHRKARQLDLRAARGEVPAVLPDQGNIAILDDADGVSAPAGFDLDNRTIEFRPVGSTASQYTYSTGSSRYDAQAAAGGQAVPLEDDAAREVSLPFPFPFFGRRYSSVHVHSDGNVTFGQPEASSEPRDFVRMVVGPARIAALFTDLDPSQPQASITQVSERTRFVVNWNNVPLYADNPGPNVPRQTFQLALYDDGRIEASYRGVTTGEAVVGVAPGGATRIEQVTFVDYTSPSSTAYSTAIVEEFTEDPRFDFVPLGEKFYRNHEDPYDFLVVFDTMPRDFSFCAAALPVRNWVRGIGLRVFQGLAEEFDASRDFGSAGRLQNIIYMGPISRYPADPTEVRPLGGGCGRNSVLTILGQEAGHRFLAYPRFLDPDTGRPSVELLGRDGQHWSFYFNSDGSFVEGNQIEDKGAGVTPRFETKQIVERFGELDQYLMGLRGPEEVRTTFLVRQASIDFPRSQNPQAGVFFDGTRRDITVPMIVGAEGTRRPDHTVSPRQFRFAFALLAGAGQTPSPADVAKLERYRTEWETFFGRAVGDRARAETRLVKQLHLSVWPASGLIQGRTVAASVILGAPASAPVNVSLSASGSQVSVPGTVTIPAGRRSAEFNLTANSSGTVQLTARVDDSYETSRAALLVRENTAGLRLEQLWPLALSLGLYLPAPEAPPTGGLGVPLAEQLIFRLRDANFLPYPGLRLAASASGSGGVAPANLITDANGWVRVNWRLDTTPGLNTLTLAVDGQPDVSARTQANGAPAPARRRDPRFPVEVP